jgi:3-hydroxyisobutyrate dehydrogenase-like beta-hydroxyacid dehydrogenase
VAANKRYMKLLVNALVINTIQTSAEALAMGRKAGLPWELMSKLSANSSTAVASSTANLAAKTYAAAKPTNCTSRPWS